ncbi:MAG: patatin-like phospholipase family protein [Acidimicrobiales bacterium]
MTPGRPFQILSLDGGCYRGLFSAALLAAFEEDLGQPVVEHFDLVTGTSTGGIIAIPLGAGRSPREVIEFYESHGSRIFARSWFRRFKHPVCAKYPSAPLRMALNGVFGDLTMADSRTRHNGPRPTRASSEAIPFVVVPGAGACTTARTPTARAVAVASRRTITRGYDINAVGAEGNRPIGLPESGMAVPVIPEPPARVCVTPSGHTGWQWREMARM